MTGEGAGTRATVALSFTYTEDEYTSAARAFYARTPHTKFNFYLGVGVVAASLLFAALAGDPYLGGMLFVVGFVAVAARYYAEYVQPRRHFRDNTKFRDTYHLTFSDEGVLFRAGEMESKLGWGFYTGVWETPDFYFLVYGEDLFSLLPKRVFRGRRQEEAAFRELLRRKLDPALGWAAAGGSRELEREYVPPAEPPDWR